MSDSSTWDEIYARRGDEELSWSEPEPVTSLRLLEAHADRHRALVDVGGGRSALVDRLLAAGWTAVTVLDLSGAALAGLGARLGATSAVDLEIADVTTWTPEHPYGAWHDRAVLHFLTDTSDQEAYVERAATALTPGGVAVVGCFGPEGPEVCSGLPVVRRDAAELTTLFGERFELRHAERTVHTTPWGVEQAFTWVVLGRR